MEYKKKAMTKDNKEYWIRNAEVSDAKSIIENLHIASEQTDFLSSIPEEILFDIEQEERFLLEREKSINEIQLCAVIDSKIVGIAGLSALGKTEKVKHRASLGISIDKKYWGLGIGRELTQACLECAKQAGYLQLELNVVSENKSAIALYRSFGFSEYGRNPKGFHSPIGGWQELILMRLELDWDVPEPKSMKELKL